MPINDVKSPSLQLHVDRFITLTLGRASLADILTLLLSISQRHLYIQALTNEDSHPKRAEIIHADISWRKIDTVAPMEHLLSAGSRIEQLLRVVNRLNLPRLLKYLCSGSYALKWLTQLSITDYMANSATQAKNSSTSRL
ncbi:hypothetical protein Trisim1_001023 [Trichoderma cf. simile WF8]